MHWYWKNIVPRVMMLAVVGLLYLTPGPEAGVNYFLMAVALTGWACVEGSQ